MNRRRLFKAALGAWLLAIMLVVPSERAFGQAANPNDNLAAPPAEAKAEDSTYIYGYMAASALAVLILFIVGKSARRSP